MTELRRTLGPFMLWGLGVGYVISGEYFGWNLGLPLGGTYGMLAATLIVTLMYVAFVLSYAELAAAIPRADGASAYASAALGPLPGLVAGLCQWIEFVFAPPAIALAVGAYLHLLVPAVPTLGFAVGAYVLLTALNIWGVRQAVLFELVVTVIAVGELLVFIAVTAPKFHWENLALDPLPHGWAGVFACFPFAIWFYLAIEGVANAAEEARNPQRDLAIGFGSAMATLVVLALAVFFCAIGVAGWHAVVYAPGSTTPSDSPLPLAMAQAVSEHSIYYSMLVGIGLFGLVASFHGILLAAARATMALGRAGYAPRLLGAVHPRTKTPVSALLVNMFVGIAAIFTGRTAEIITLSCFGALGMYIVSMIAVLALRKKQPALARPFVVPLYPATPIIALVLAVLCLVSVAVASPQLALVFLGVLAVASIASWTWRARAAAA